MKKSNTHRILNNNAIDNALRMALFSGGRTGFGFGGDSDAAEGSTYTSNISHETPSFREAEDRSMREYNRAVESGWSPTRGGDDGGGNRDPERVLTGRQSGFEGAPPVNMPANIGELLGYNRARQQMMQQQQADAAQEAQRNAEIAQSLRSSSFFSPTINMGLNVNPMGKSMGEASSTMGWNPTDVQGRSVMGPISGLDNSIMGFNAPASQSMMTQQMRDAMNMQGQSTTSSDWQMSDADINKMMSSVNITPTTVAQNAPVTITPTVEKAVVFDPVTQNFVPVDEASQQATRLAQAEAAQAARVMANLMPTPNAPMAAFPHSITPSTATQVATYDRPAFPHTPTPNMQQIVQASVQPDVSAPFVQPNRPYTPTPQTAIQQVAQNVPFPTKVIRDAVVAASSPPVAVASTPKSVVDDAIINQDALVLPGRKTFQLPTNAPLPVARPADVKESNPIASIIDSIKADLAFKEGERINALEASGKTATYPGYSTASDPLAAQRAYLTDIGLDPNNPADMAKVKARIIQQDGQDKVDYYTKSLSEALFGTPSEEQKVAAALNVARESGGGDRTPVQQASTQTPTVTPPPYKTELSEGNLALPHPEGLSAQQWANKYAGGDINKVHARIKFINGAPTLEYYTV